MKKLWKKVTPIPPEMHTNTVQIWKCDQCAEMIEQSIQCEYPRWNYCPNCGADMRVAERGDELCLKDT